MATAIFALNDRAVGLVTPKATDVLFWRSARASAARHRGPQCGAMIAEMIGIADAIKTSTSSKVTT
ncbi:MAG: hypothetical protein ABI277_09995 [Burkholderiaceae bacterium]